MELSMGDENAKRLAEVNARWEETRRTTDGMKFYANCNKMVLRDMPWLLEIARVHLNEATAPPDPASQKAGEHQVS